MLFATYSLDEIVLAKLFSENKLSKSRSIIILCDVRRHKSQGYLRAQGYTNAQVCEIVIKKTAKNCPVFHPKLWMELSKDYRYAHKILSGSFNISEYHFNQENYVFDTVNLVEERIRIDFARKIKAIVSRSESGTSRAKISAFTFIFDFISNPTLIISDRSAGEHISKLLTASKDTPRRFCAPFISCKAIRKLGAVDGTLGWKGARSNGLQLHAKCLESKHKLFSGSVNMTEQALWGNGDAPINCELLEIHRKPADFSLKKVCKGFDRIRLEDIGNETMPADPDVDDGDWGGDWNRELKLKVAAPCSVSLVYRESGDDVAVKIDGKHKHFSRLKLYTRQDSKIPVLHIARKKMARLTHAQQCNLAELILSKAVITAQAISSGKTVWTKDVDLGEFWLDIQNIHHLNGNGSGGGEGGGHTGSKEQLRKIVFDDIRDSRDTLLNSDISHHSYGRIRWLHRHTKKIVGIPKWCFNFAKEIKDLVL